MDNKKTTFDIKIPIKCVADEILSFLKSVEVIFSWKNQKKPNVLFNLSEVRDIDILGLLLSYKIIEFCVENQCICNSHLRTNEYVDKKLSEFKFQELLNSYLENRRADYTNLDFIQGKKLFIAPFPLLRENAYTKSKIKDSYFPKIEEYYKEKSSDKKENIASMIFQCFSEILLNFWEHAVNDTKSIIIANGNTDFVEIACADTGNGILSTLGPVLEGCVTKDDILLKSLEMGVTSKKDTYHMGCGLWIINQIINSTKGKLLLISEGQYVRNDFGKLFKGECPYWGGTIIYVFLSLTSPKNLSDIISGDECKALNDLKINFQ